jgi:hypothetical protein
MLHQRKKALVNQAPFKNLLLRSSAALGDQSFRCLSWEERPETR